MRLKAYLASSENPEPDHVADLREQVRVSSRVRTLLSGRGSDGTIPLHPYAKWSGAHWVLATLADLGYPAGDESLAPLRDQVYDWLLSQERDRPAARGHHPYLAPILSVAGRYRVHASMEGNALHSTLRLGLADERSDELARRLVRWQWPDGGWNCDRRPRASHSSFTESLIPLRGLALHARTTGAKSSAAAARRAGEMFLCRELFRRRSNRCVISLDFVKLHHPCYWHYDILVALTVMTEAGFVGDPRCSAALDLLESKWLPEGGFPADAKYCVVIDTRGDRQSLVDWGSTERRKMNEFVSAEALLVLKAAGRL